MKIAFPYKPFKSPLFGAVKRPVAKVDFWSNKFEKWVRYTLIVDTGADYTLLPAVAALDLGINLEKNCYQIETFGIGGRETVYILKDKVPIKIGDYQEEILLGILGRDGVPPLLGREECLNQFSLHFVNFQTIFST